VPQPRRGSGRGNEEADECAPKTWRHRARLRAAYIGHGKRIPRGGCCVGSIRGGAQIYSRRGNTEGKQGPRPPVFLRTGLLVSPATPLRAVHVCSTPASCSLPRGLLLYSCQSLSFLLVSPLLLSPLLLQVSTSFCHPLLLSPLLSPSLGCLVVLSETLNFLSLLPPWYACYRFGRL
jgi:hypothetical protein